MGILSPYFTEGFSGGVNFYTWRNFINSDGGEVS